MKVSNAWKEVFRRNLLSMEFRCLLNSLNRQHPLGQAQGKFNQIFFNDKMIFRTNYLISQQNGSDEANGVYKSLHSQIDQWCAQLADCCLLADDVLPHVRKQKRKWPNWHEDIKPYKDDCIWWHNLWVTSDKPSEGIIFNNMREFKRQLAYANRRNKRKYSQMRKEKIVVAISENRMIFFFKEVKKLNLMDKTTPSIDGHVDLTETADHLADKYDRLYNSVLSDAEAENIYGTAEKGDSRKPRNITTRCLR